MATWIRLDAVANIADLELHAFEIDDEPIVVFRSGDSFYAFRDQCSHADVPLSAGHVEGNALVCWKHGAKFDLDSGQPLSLPATAPIDRCELKVEAGILYADADSI